MAQDINKMIVEGAIEKVSQFKMQLRWIPTKNLQSNERKCFFLTLQMSNRIFWNGLSGLKYAGKITILSWHDF